jgi:hypothetical protein
MGVGRYFLEPHNSLYHFQRQNFEFDGSFFIQVIQQCIKKGGQKIVLVKK